MPPNDHRFLLIDLETKKSVPLSTDQVQAAFFRLEITQPVDGAYISTEGPKHQEIEEWQLHR